MLDYISEILSRYGFNIDIQKQCVGAYSILRYWEKYFKEFQVYRSVLLRLPLMVNQKRQLMVGHEIMFQLTSKTSFREQEEEERGGGKEEKEAERKKEVLEELKEEDVSEEEEEEEGEFGKGDILNPGMKSSTKPFTGYEWQT